MKQQTERFVFIQIWEWKRNEMKCSGNGDGYENNSKYANLSRKIQWHEHSQYVEVDKYLGVYLKSARVNNNFGWN